MTKVIEKLTALRCLHPTNFFKKIGGSNEKMSERANPGQIVYLPEDEAEKALKIKALDAEGKEIGPAFEVAKK